MTLPYLRALDEPSLDWPAGQLVGSGRVLKLAGDDSQVFWTVRNDGGSPGTAEFLTQLLDRTGAVVMDESRQSAVVNPGSSIGAAQVITVPAGAPDGFYPVRVEIADITGARALVASRQLEVSLNGPKVTVASATAPPGSTVLVAVTLESGFGPIRGYQVNLLYNPLRLTAPVVTVGPGTPSGWLFSTANPAPGDVRALTVNLTGTAVPIDGIIFFVQFTIPAAAPLGDTLALVALADLAGPGGTTHPTVAQDGVMSILTVPPPPVFSAGGRSFILNGTLFTVIPGQFLTWPFDINTTLELRIEGLYSGPASTLRSALTSGGPLQSASRTTSFPTGVLPLFFQLRTKSISWNGGTFPPGSTLIFNHALQERQSTGAFTDVAIPDNPGPFRIDFA